MKGWVVRNFRTLKRQEKMSNVPDWGMWAFTERPFLLQFKKNKEKENRKKKINIKTLHLDRPDTISPHQPPHVSLCRNHQNYPPILIHVHGTRQDLSPAEVQRNSSLQIWQFVGSLSNPKTPGGRTVQNLEPLALHGDAVNSSILPNITFKVNCVFLD